MTCESIWFDESNSCRNETKSKWYENLKHVSNVWCESTFQKNETLMIIDFVIDVIFLTKYSINVSTLDIAKRNETYKSKKCKSYCMSCVFDSKISTIANSSFIVTIKRFAQIYVQTSCETLSWKIYAKSWCCWRFTTSKFTSFESSSKKIVLLICCHEINMISLLTNLNN